MGIVLAVLGTAGFMVLVVVLWFATVNVVFRTTKKITATYRDGLNELERTIREHHVPGDTNGQVYLDTIARIHKDVDAIKPEAKK